MNKTYLDPWVKITKTFKKLQLNQKKRDGFKNKLTI